MSSYRILRSECPKQCLLVGCSGAVDIGRLQKFLGLEEDKRIAGKEEEEQQLELEQEE